ncbi:hypothetical protein [Humisphaera borealis]|uniref:Uncharacterized protein n=1 Tax=Humisphaera borealis TaxID=2807512 RepID=A0A7M2WUS7_9BACT|nr:hypothetical protein [Humisphaera borealis]QOV89287.1 hypothetical protein IPV69_24275 [Humisphaera borealis]
MCDMTLNHIVGVVTIEKRVCRVCDCSGLELVRFPADRIVELKVTPDGCGHGRAYCEVAFIVEAPRALSA